MTTRFLFLLTVYFPVGAVSADIGPALPVYTESDLMKMFETNTHLKKVKADDCQLLQDIIARATKIDLPAYQFLYGDMMAWGVCVDRDVESGIVYMKKAAKQGLPAALEQLGRYYSKGTLVQRDEERAVRYFKEAASLGFVKAKLNLAELLLNDHGSPLDYEDAYRWLSQTATADKATHRKVAELMKGLENRMPRNIIERAKSASY
ncbi:flagellar protein MotX [Veronia pacifica]|uniref:Flagellar protein MotX n=1 Tax=Veronia pacifica TaxID=1080227 RepID=A0A1C3ED67_9GAMM|nr:flagellar protein MotX [Veronia pacifica]